LWQARSEQFVSRGEESMPHSDLELCTSQELIAELMRRPTFLGVVVHAEEDFKNGVWQDERIFKVHFNSNLDHAAVGRLLEVVCEHLDRSQS
jgi:hypothetical protein